MPVGARRTTARERSFRYGLCAAVLGSLIAGNLRPGGAADAPDWRVRSSDHFEVFYLTDPGFAAAVGGEAERLYSRINTELGLDRLVKREHLSFWLWDGRCKIYLYRTREEYLQRTGAPDWSAAFVDYRNRVVHSFAHADQFLAATLPHELAHILFREFVGHDNDRVPRWLDEGVAQHAATHLRERSLREMRQRVRSGRYLPFSTFGEADPGKLDGLSAGLYYLQAASVVHFFIEHYGRGRFLEFCSNLRDGYPVERALSFATGSRVTSMAGLEEAWVRYYR